MRYYDIQIDGGVRYTSHPSGPNSPPDPGALHVEMNLFSTNQRESMNGSHIKIWGVSLQQVSEAKNLNPVGGTSKNIVVYGGMGKGLPLAKPGQAGLLIKGQIIQAFGNWIGTNMTLDLIVVGGYSGPSPDLVFNYRAGQDLGTAIKNTLSTAFPKMTPDVNIKKLSANYDQIGFYGTLRQFADYINGFSKVLAADGSYLGVEMVMHDGKIKVHDGSQQSTAKKISFEDLVGQPVFAQPAVVSVTTVLRSDIQVGDTIELPLSILTNTPGSQSGKSNPDQSISFNGTFPVNKVHHLGSFKSPAGDAWVSVYDCPIMGQQETINQTIANDAWPATGA